MAAVLCRPYRRFVYSASSGKYETTIGKYILFLNGEVRTQHFYDVKIVAFNEEYRQKNAHLSKNVTKIFGKFPIALLKTIPIYGNLIVPEGTIFVKGCR